MSSSLLASVHDNLKSTICSYIVYTIVLIFYFKTRRMSVGGPFVPGSMKLLSDRYVCMFVHALSIIALFMEVRSDKV